jgi:hypothetical protein
MPESVVADAVVPVVGVPRRLATADAAKDDHQAAGATAPQLHRQKARVRKTVLRLLVQNAASRLKLKRLRPPQPLAPSALRRRPGPRVTVSGPSGDLAAAMNLAVTSLVVTGHTVIGHRPTRRMATGIAAIASNPVKRPARRPHPSASRNVHRRGRQRSGAPKAQLQRRPEVSPTTCRLSSGVLRGP